MNAFENANVASGAAKWAAVSLLGACAGAGLVYTLLNRAAPHEPAPAVMAPAQPPAPVIVQIMPPAPASPQTIVREVPVQPPPSSQAGPAPGGGEPPPAAQPAPPSPKPRQPTSPATGTINHRININVAGQAELELLPSVGPALAKRIIEYREKHGPFKSTADLDAVKGIGAKTLEKLLPLITVEAEVQPR